MSAHTTDVIDLRELAQAWSDEIDEGDVTADYATLCEQLGCDPTPDGLEHHGDATGAALIHEHYFTEYAQELAEDCGMVNADAIWPNNCIDWTRAARELQMDYTAVTFDGATYYTRS